MTTTYAPTETDAPSRTPLLAAAGLGSSALLTAVGSFWSRSIKDGVQHSVGEWLFCVGIAAVTTVIAFGLVVRTAPRGNAARRSLITATVAVLSLAVFWAGIPAVLVAAALACALVDKDRRGSFSRMSAVALVLSGLVLAAATAAAIFG
jgi:Na+/serine symporter